MHQVAGETPYGRIAGLTDPGGAMFWIVETDGTGQPERDDLDWPLGAPYN